MKLGNFVPARGCGRAALVASGRFAAGSDVLAAFRCIDFREAGLAARWIDRAARRWVRGRQVLDSATTALYAEISAIVEQIRGIARDRARRVEAMRERALREIEAKALHAETRRQKELDELVADDRGDSEVVEPETFGVPVGVSMDWALG